VAVPAAAHRVIEADVDAAPLDLLSIAGGSVYKRVIPLLLGLVIVIALIVYLVVR
jgi:hypothetical protein